MSIYINEIALLSPPFNVGYNNVIPDEDIVYDTNIEDELVLETPNVLL